MDDIKIFTKNEKELKTLLQTVRIFSKDIKMECEIEICVMLIMNKRKRKTTKGIE